MPTAVSYPGVYVEELSSGVHTITGVATSITAFIGRAPRGPADGTPESPVFLNSFADYERTFGGLAAGYPLSYAVRDFYLNGGSQALIVRIYSAKPSGLAKATLNARGLALEAASEGSWGNSLRARVDNNASADVAARYNLLPTDLFNLFVHDSATGVTESFLNVSVAESPRRIDRVLKDQSDLVRFASGGVLPANPPNAHAPPAVGVSIWDDNNASSKVVAPLADDGQGLDPTAYQGSRLNKTGVYALMKADLFNLLCIPPDTREGDTHHDVYSAALAYCAERRAVLIVDPPVAWTSANAITANNNSLFTNLGLNGGIARNGAVYFPRVVESDPLREGQLDTFPACGLIAGAIAQTDAMRGVWKASAGIDAALGGVQRLAVNLTDAENGQLNPLGINCLRTFPVIGHVVWGARTLRGADQLADEYKYLPVRRLALFLEESLYRGTKWAVFEPNDEPLWAQLRLNIGAFMHDLFRQGAFAGQTPREAYYVKCNGETTTQNDVDHGIVNVLIGFAPLKPAEFVILKFQQMAGQIAT